MEFASAHIEALKQTCIEHVKVNQPIPKDVMEMALAPLPSEWFNDAEEVTTIAPLATSTASHATSVFTPALLQDLGQVGCPFDCYGNGDCNNGTYFKVYVIH